ncbi:MAG: putative porin [Myxococcota bacterium]|nr:putative porin [Myxococcota bacterium]
MLQLRDGTMTYKSLLSLIVITLVVPTGSSSAGWEDKDAPGSLLERLTLSADGRLRWEIDAGRPDAVGGADRDVRHRGRGRFRVGMKAQITEQWSGHLRVQTGNDDNSPHENFGSRFGTDGNWQISLGRAYLEYKPEPLEGVRMTGGRLPLAFKKNPVFGETLWDDDLNVDGAQFDYTHAHDDHGYAATASYSVLGFGDVVDDFEKARLIAAQVSGWANVGDVKLGVMQGAYIYRNLADTGVGGVPADGGSPDVLNTILYGTVPVTSDISLTLAGDLIVNPSADDDEMGYTAGASVGFPLCGKSAKAYYQWARIEENALFGPASQDDHQFSGGARSGLGAKTGYSGHIAGVKVAFTKRLQLHLWTLSAKDLRDGNSDTFQQRYRMDFNVKF